MTLTDYISRKEGRCYIYIFCPTSVRRNHWGRLAGTCSPVLIWNMQSSVEEENSLIRHESALHFEWREVDGLIKPQDACCCGKGDRRRDCSPADLSQSRGRSKGGRLGFDEEGSLPTKQGFQQPKKKKKGERFLCSHTEVPFKISKKENKNFVEEKQKKQNETINYQSSRKGTPRVEAPTRIDIFPPS